MNNEQFVAELGKLNKSATFLTLSKYRNAQGSVADYSIVFHISYKSALEKSIQILQSLPINTEVERQAQEELLESFNRSLNNIHTTDDVSKEAHYATYEDTYGNTIKGCKLHRATNTLHLYGRVVNKKVYIPGSYKEKNSRPLTRVKAKMRNKCPVGSFRQFKITPDQVERIQVQNLSLLPPSEA